MKCKLREDKNKRISLYLELSSYEMEKYILEAGEQPEGIFKIYVEARK